MLWDSFAFTGRGIYAPKPVFETGSWVVVAVFILSIIGVFAYRRYAKFALYNHGRDLPRGWPRLRFCLSLPFWLICYGQSIGQNTQSLRV